jgi:probable HAF family extracellular repeat protein
MIVTAPVIAHDSDQSKGEFQPATYCVFEIGRLTELPPGEISLDVRAINNRNQIVGWTALAGVPPLHPFIWDRRYGMRDLGSLPGHANGIAADINDAGTVVGEATDFATGQSLAFTWTRRTGMRELDVSLGGVDSVATGINRFGQIAGTSQTGAGDFHALLRDVNGDVLDLGALPDGSGSSSATAVNDRGQVVGTRGPRGQITEGFVWDERHGMQPLIEDPPPFFVPFPLGINNHGVVVGEVLGTDPTRAFRWTRREGLQDLGALSDLDTHYTSARAINRWGTIVGGSQTPSGLVHAFVWNRRTGMRDLNELIDPGSELPSQAVLLVAQAINDFGSIALMGFVPGEESQRGFLLEPRRHSDKACR